MSSSEGLPPQMKFTEIIRREGTAEHPHFGTYYSSLRPEIVRALEDPEGIPLVMATALTNWLAGLPVSGSVIYVGEQQDRWTALMSQETYDSWLRVTKGCTLCYVPALPTGGGAHELVTALHQYFRGYGDAGGFAAEFAANPPEVWVPPVWKAIIEQFALFVLLGEYLALMIVDTDKSVAKLMKQSPPARLSGAGARKQLNNFLEADTFLNIRHDKGFGETTAIHCLGAVRARQILMAAVLMRAAANYGIKVPELDSPASWAGLTNAQLQAVYDLALAGPDGRSEGSTEANSSPNAEP